eukprot:3365510-Amphidinium_carterae.1
MRATAAERFIHCLLEDSCARRHALQRPKDQIDDLVLQLAQYCGRHEHGTRFRDELKGWRQQAVEKVESLAIMACHLLPDALTSCSCQQARGLAGFTASAALSFAADFTSRARAGSHRASISAETQ